ncbi:MAG: TatD family hydrolase, partial [Pseudomonadota bacterium]
DEDTARILEEEYANGPFKAVLHCYTGGPELAELAVRLGMIISFTGVVTFKKSEDLRAIAANVPLDQILVETDAPYLAPMPYRGKVNEPAYVRYTAETIATVKNIGINELATATTQNFMRYFDKVPPDAIRSTIPA